MFMNIPETSMHFLRRRMMSQKFLVFSRSFQQVPSYDYWCLEWLYKPMLRAYFPTCGGPDQRRDIADPDTQRRWRDTSLTEPDSSSGPGPAPRERVEQPAIIVAPLVDRYWLNYPTCGKIYRSPDMMKPGGHSTCNESDLQLGKELSLLRQQSHAKPRLRPRSHTWTRSQWGSGRRPSWRWVSYRWNYGFERLRFTS